MDVTKFVLTLAIVVWLVMAERGRRNKDAALWATGLICANIYIAATFLA